MAARIEISTDRGTLDLEDGAENSFYITRQVHDLHNFETRNADFTKTIKIPATPRNVDILDAYFGEASSINTTIPCKILMDGVLVAPFASLLFGGSTLSNQEATYDVVILYGNFGLFESIKEGTIDEMNWADLATQWEVPDLIAISDNTTDMVFPVCDWYARNTGNIYIGGLGDQNEFTMEANWCGFFMYANEIIRRILEEAGYTLFVAANVPTDYSLVALACPVTKFAGLTNIDQLNFSGTVENVANQVVNGATERAVFPNEITDSGDDWSTITNEWTVPNTGTYRVSLQGDYTMNNGSAVLPPSRLVIYNNLVEIAFFETPLDGVDVPFYFTVELGLVVGDLIYAEIEASAGGNNDVLTLNDGSSFTLGTPGNDVDRTVQPSEFIPQLNKSDFIANILKLFNLVLLTDDITKIITLRPFDDIYDEQEQDLTPFIDTGLNKIETENSISSLGQISRFQWLEDNLLRRDVNQDILFKNQLLSKEADVISMFFSACDNSVLLFDVNSDTFLKAKIPSISLESTAGAVSPQLNFDDINTGEFTLSGSGSEGFDWRVGDYFKVGLNLNPTVYLYYRVIAKSSQLQGTCQPPTALTTGTHFVWASWRPTTEDPEARLAIIRDDGGEENHTLCQGTFSNLEAFPAAALTANWMDSLKMSEVTTTYYKNILSALQAPEVIKAWFNIPVGLFVTLDFMRPVYMSNFNAFYYINKIEQFKVEQKVRLELVRISVIT